MLAGMTREGPQYGRHAAMELAQLALGVDMAAAPWCHILGRLMQLAAQADVDQARDMLDDARTESESLKARLRQVRGLAQSSAYSVRAKAGMMCTTQPCRQTRSCWVARLQPQRLKPQSSKMVWFLHCQAAAAASHAWQVIWAAIHIVHAGRQQLERMLRQLRFRSFRTSLSPFSMLAGLQVRRFPGMLLECMVHRHARLCGQGSSARGLPAVSARLERKLAALSSPCLVHSRQASAARSMLLTASGCLANGCRLIVSVQTHKTAKQHKQHTSFHRLCWVCRCY